MTTTQVPARLSKRASRRTRSPCRAAALHAQGDAWRIVVVESSSATRILTAESLRIGDTHSVRELLDRHDVTMLIRLIPAGHAIVRVPDLPDEAMHDEDSLKDVLGLLAESELPVNVPAHRRAAGVIRAPGALLETPLIVGWPSRTGDDPAPIDLERERWTSELVPLLVLAALGKHNATGTSVAAYACAQADSIGIVGVNGSRTAMRGIPEPGDDESVFTSRARSALTELCSHMGADETHSTWPAGSHRLVLEKDSCAALAQRLAGAEDSTDWCDRYGMAAATALAAVSGEPSTQQLFTLRATDLHVKGGRVERTLAALSTTRGAVIAIMLAVLVLLVGSVGSSWAQAVLLESRADRLQGALAQNAEADLSIEDQVAIFGELDRSRWPMTKLLGDLVAAMPADGPDNLVLADSIELDAGDSFTVRGTADSLELVNRFVAALNGSGVFENADIRRYEAVSAGVRIEFEIEGLVVRPFGIARGLHDYSGANTVANHIYGISDDAQASESAAQLAQQSTDSADEASKGNASSNGTRQSAPTFEGGAKRGAGRSAEDIPPPLTDDEITAMNQLEAMAAYGKRKNLARSRTDLTPEVTQRLLDEAQKCRDRAEEAKKEAKAEVSN